MGTCKRPTSSQKLSSFIPSTSISGICMSPSDDSSSMLTSPHASRNFLRNLFLQINAVVRLVDKVSLESRTVVYFSALSVIRCSARSVIFSFTKRFTHVQAVLLNLRDPFCLTVTLTQMGMGMEQRITVLGSARLIFCCLWSNSFCPVTLANFTLFTPVSTQ